MMDARQALEAAAKVAEDYEGKGMSPGNGYHTQLGDAYLTRADIADAIRAIPVPEPEGTARERAEEIATQNGWRHEETTRAIALALTEAEQRGREAERKEIKELLSEHADDNEEYSASQAMALRDMIDEIDALAHKGETDG